MDCPKCQCRLGVYWTIQVEDNQCRRLRKCPECGTKSATMERLGGEVQGDGRHGGRRTPLAKQTESKETKRDED